MVRILPYQGAPLATDTLCVALVLDSVVTATDEPLGRPTALRDVLAGRALQSSMHGPRSRLPHRRRGCRTPRCLRARRIVSAAAFRSDPAYELVAAREEVLADPLPVLSNFTPRGIFDTYCVYEASVDMPVFQGGEPPYQPTGGGWVHSSFGELVLDRTETARVFVTIPRVAAGTDSYRFHLRAHGRRRRSAACGSAGRATPTAWCSCPALGRAGVRGGGRGRHQQHRRAAWRPAQRDRR
ncbi:MAG: hypothetical protein IPG17_21065 [Sandaracinaceae bacterium]|nr:hypothetical protein [Sandaracinaceae bacterium]